MLTLLAMLLAQSPIYIRNDGGYVGRALDGVDCYGVTCSQSGSRLRIQGSGGSSGPMPSGLCGDGGSALGWDGGAFYCADVVKAGSCSAGQYVSAVSASGAPTCSSPASNWVTALDCNLTTQSSAPLDAGDGNYSVCSVTWNQFNSTQTLNRSDLVNGVGLKIQPVQATNFDNGTLTDPGFRLRLTDLISTFRWNMRLRVTLQVTDNAAATYHHVYMVVAACRAACESTNYVSGSGEVFNLQGALRAYQTGGITTQAVRSIAGEGVVLSQAQTYNARILSAEWPDGVGGGMAMVTSDLPDGGTFPSTLPLNLSGQSVASGTASFQPLGPRSETVYLYITAGRAGSATGYLATLERLKVEYQP